MTTSRKKPSNAQAALDLLKSHLQPYPPGHILRVHIQPGAATTEIVGVHGDRLKIRVASPPIDGKANAELRKYLSAILGLPLRQISIIRGLNCRQKDIAIGRVSAP